MCVLRNTKTIYSLIDCTDSIFIRGRRDAPEEKTLRLKKSRKGNFRRAINISEAANALLLEMDRNGDGEKKTTPYTHLKYGLCSEVKMTFRFSTSGRIELDEFIYACTHNSSIVKVFESALERVIESTTNYTLSIDSFSF
jgi:hypothetical protein